MYAINEFSKPITGKLRICHEEASNVVRNDDLRLAGIPIVFLITEVK